MEINHSTGLYAVTRELIELAKGAGLAGTVKELYSLQKFASASFYRLAVAPAFQFELNVFMDGVTQQAVFPGESFPLLPFPVTFQYGQNTAEITGTDYRSETAAASALSAGQLAANAAYIAELTLNIREKWLSDLNIALSCYKGLGGGDAAMPENSPAVYNSDAVLVPLSATLGLGLTEKAALRYIVTEKQVQVVEVVVCNLSFVPEHERDEVLHYLRKALQEISPAIAVYVPASAAPNEMADLIGHTRTWPVPADYRKARNRMGKKRLLSILADMNRALAEKVTALKALEAKALAGQTAQISALEQQGFHWNEIRGTIEKKRLDCIEKARALAEESSVSTLEKLVTELGVSKNPKEWWQKVAKTKFNQEMKAFYRDFDHKLQTTINLDIAELRNLLKVRFNAVFLPVDAQAKLAGNRISGGDGHEGLTDWQTIRIWTRAVATVSTAVLFALGGPIGLGIGALVFAGGELTAKARIEAQSKHLIAIMQPIITEAFNTSMEAASKRLNDIYKVLKDDLNRLEAAWWEEKMKGPEVSGDSELAFTRQAIVKLSNIKDTLEKP